MKRLIILFLIIFVFNSFFSFSSVSQFNSAKPVWPEGKDNEMNFMVGFRAVFNAPEDSKVILKVAGSTVYRIYVNGKFSGYGPARGPHEYYRVDEWDISRNIKRSENLVAIEIAGYNVNNYYTLDQPSFLQAEVISEGKVLASTSGNGIQFDALLLKERVQKVQRYSFQRTFSEVYKLSPGFDNWQKEANAFFNKVKCSILPDKQLILRCVPYPEFAVLPALWNVAYGKVDRDILIDKISRDRSIRSVGPLFKGFSEKELEVIPSIELQKIKSTSRIEINKPYNWKTKINLKENSYHILDFGTNYTGFLGAKVKCSEDTRFFFTFDEILVNGDVDFKRLGCVNIVEYNMPAGIYKIETFEPYTLRYLKFIVLKGECEIEDVYLRDYANPEAYKAHFAASDERLNRLFDAGRETFRQNAVDIFMDCPSRERAGWLCDSYFTARAGFNLCGNNIIEKNFIENFLLPKKFDYLPDGMLPMCYPAEHYNGRFIPNWALFFVVELEEYLQRSGDKNMVNSLKNKVLKLFDYFKLFENEDGLLEKLESWVFVEWSRANDFVQDVNYPTNMLYAGALDAAGRIYGMPEFSQKAEKIREVIRKQSYDGEFFVDNAVREDGKLKTTNNKSEVCQYFAFYFDVATSVKYGRTWDDLRENFGPKRKLTKEYPDVHYANAFIGNVVRLEILSRYGLCQQILDESIDYLLYMADRTGTLWENDSPHASCNHGFASHICHVLFRDVLGVYKIDAVNKNVQLRFADLKLKWCEGIIPVGEEKIELRWRKEGEKTLYKLKIPAGYTVDVKNIGSGELVRLP